MALFDSLYNPDDDVEVCVAPEIESCHNYFLIALDSLLGATIIEGLLMGFTSTSAEYSWQLSS